MANCSKSRLEEDLTIRVQLWSGHDYTASRDVWSWKATIKSLLRGSIEAHYATTPRQAVAKAMDAYLAKVERW